MGVYYKFKNQFSNMRQRGCYADLRTISSLICEVRPQAASA